MYDLTIVIPCKGRLHHLKRTLPYTLQQDVRATYRVLVVDYGCPDGTFDWIKSCYDPLLTCIKVNDNVDIFNLNRCRNLGIKYCDSRVVALLDADIAPPTYFASKALTFLGAYGADYLHYAVDGESAFHTFDGAYSYNPLPYQLEGQYPITPGPWAYMCSFMRPRVAELINGYDEGFQNWGYDDVDFKVRSDKAGVKDIIIGGQFTYLHHPEEESTRFYAEKDKAKSRAENRLRLEDKERTINPNGYGITKDYALWPE